MELVPTVISLMMILMISTQAADAGPKRNRAIMDGTSLRIAEDPQCFVESPGLVGDYLHFDFGFLSGHDGAPVP